MDVDDWYADQLVELLEIGDGLPFLGQQQLDNVDCNKIPTLRPLLNEPSGLNI
jgi:hypothetical protein